MQMLCSVEVRYLLDTQVETYEGLELRGKYRFESHPHIKGNRGQD